MMKIMAGLVLTLLACSAAVVRAQSEVPDIP